MRAFPRPVAEAQRQLLLELVCVLAEPLSHLSLANLDEDTLRTVMGCLRHDVVLVRLEEDGLVTDSEGNLVLKRAFLQEALRFVFLL